MVVASGAYDCITAKLIEQAGVAAVYMTGTGTAAILGYPDFGLVSMSEMVANAGRIAAAVELPVIAEPIPATATNSTSIAPFASSSAAASPGFISNTRNSRRNAATLRASRLFCARITWQRSALPPVREPTVTSRSSPEPIPARWRASPRLSLAPTPLPAGADMAFCRGAANTGGSRDGST